MKKKHIEELLDSALEMYEEEMDKKEELKNRVDKAMHKIQLLQMDGELSIRDITELASILGGSDKE